MEPIPRGAPMSYIKEQPWFTSLMDKGNVIGECACCGSVCREHEFTLSDCYAVYRGRCPKCNAINLLGGGGRGYNNRTMTLVLPTDHEIRMNKWEEDVPTRPCDCS